MAPKAIKKAPVKTAPRKAKPTKKPAVRAGEKATVVEPVVTEVIQTPETMMDSES